MNTAKIRKVLSNLATAASIAVIALLLLMIVLAFLINQGWQHPIQSLHAKAEMRSYLKETYTGQDLRIGFPAYNPIGDDFYSFIKDGDRQILFGLTFAKGSGVTELNAFQNKHGYWIMTSDPVG